MSEAADGRGGVVGVDVGGTFTDVFALDEATGEVRIGKVPTTRPDQSGGFVSGVRRMADPARVATLVHGTTAGTNALLERKGARIGVVTTAGFRDVLEMRRRDRPRAWGLWGSFEPVVPRRLRLEVPERTLADGTVREAVDPAAVRAAAEALLAEGCAACAILFVNAYANPANERAAAEAVRALWPNEHVIASHEMLPEIREFERFSTTALNAYLQPEVGGYLSRLEAALAREGFGGAFLIVQSNGGVMDVDTARARPALTALSGPAAGVVAAREIAAAAGFADVITGDMGGTSFDVSLIAGGEAALKPQTTVDFGLVIRAPMVEIATIGAGGGSIAWIDKGGLLRIGPESAGAEPGPVAYGRGGERPTVTDANIVLGRIDPERPLGEGLGALDRGAAERALLEHVGRPLGLGAAEAAEAVIRVANARMAGAIRLVSIERGRDPKRFALMPFGGGGALHAAALAREVGLGRVLVPRYPGVVSALGCAIADMRRDFVTTLNTGLDGLDLEALRALMQAHRDAGEAALAASGLRFEARETRFSLDMAYAGQTHTVAADFATAADAAPTPAPTREDLMAAFEASYAQAFGRPLAGVPARVLNLRAAAVGRRPRFDLALLAPGPEADEAAAARGARRVHVGGGWVETRVYDRLALPVGARIAGPAVLEQPDATILVEPGFAGEVDRFGNLALTREDA